MPEPIKGLFFVVIQAHCSFKWLKFWLRLIMAGRKKEPEIITYWTENIHTIKPVIHVSLTFLNSFILPLFGYGDIIWGDRGNVSLMSELQVLHNKAAHLILDLPAHSSTTEALKRLDWKPLSRRRMEHHAIFMHKLLNNHLCHSTQIWFNGDFHGYNTRSRYDTRRASASTRWGQCS